ncbi:MAG: ATP-dependent Clp protease ATP-binding subunit ClpC, partial [Myxococcota bacterium]
MQFKGLTASIELSRVLDCAQDIADSSEVELSSAHLLLALFTVQNRAKTILDDRGLVVDSVIDEVLSVGDEPLDAVSVVHSKSAQFTESCGSNVVGTLHLLAGLCRVSRSQAYMVLVRLGVRPSELRTTVIRYLTGGMPRHYLTPTATPHADRVFPVRPADSGDSRGRPAAVAVAEPEVEYEPEVEFERAREFAPEAAPQRKRSKAQAPRPQPKPILRVEEDVVDLEEAAASRYVLDPDTYPMLTKLGRNLTVLAETGRLDPLIGRTSEVEQLVDILNKRRSNNPCLVGEPGVGKTAVVEGLAQLIVRRDATVGALGQKVLVELEMGGLVAGTQLRGAFAERLAVLKDEVAQADGRIVLFIDEIHTLIGAGSGDGALDAANDLKSALARGEFPCIGATTEREFRRHIEADPALERRFQLVNVEEPSEEDAIAVLSGIAPKYAEHHRVNYRTEAIAAAVRLSARWVQERFLPAKAIDVLDVAGAYASRHGKSFVSPED